MIMRSLDDLLDAWTIAYCSLESMGRHAPRPPVSVSRLFASWWSGLRLTAPERRSLILMMSEESAQICALTFFHH